MRYQPVYWFLVLSFVVLINIAWIVPYVYAPRQLWNESIPLQFEDGDDSQYQLESVCGCRSGLALGSNERIVSNTWFAQAVSERYPDPRGLSSFAWVWGQLSDHDLVKSFTDLEATVFTIPFEPTPNVTMTLTQVQKTLDPRTGCTTSKNGLSSRMDASTVYSDYKDPERLVQLRAGNGALCKLAMDAYNLPTIRNGTFFCGDVRCGEHVLLTALHTILAREHNRWCDVLATQNGGAWSEEERFWRARRLVIAVIQKITYQEWLPALMGSQYSLLHTVAPLGTGLSLTTAFSGAAYRFHTMVPNMLGPWNLTDLFFQNDFIRTNGLETVLHAGQETPAETMENKVVDGLRNRLFGQYGMDLVTMNLFRGRELKLATYTQLATCHKVDPYPGIPYDGIQDPYLGMLLEPRFPGSSLPRLIAHIVAEQFKRLRDNDEFFYTRMAQQIGPVNYDVIRQTTLSQLFMRNTQLTHFPQNAFYVYN